MVELNVKDMASSHCVSAVTRAVKSAGYPATWLIRLLAAAGACSGAVGQ